jgi:hypothetical protein
MEQPDEEIKTVSFSDMAVEIIYANNITETIIKNSEGYNKLYIAWLAEQPMFISDIYKTQMRDLIFASRNTTPSLLQMNNFLSETNRKEAVKFIEYMRKRDLTFEKKKWI